MKGRVNENGLLPYINAVVHKHTKHCRNPLFNGSLAMNTLYHRRIEPNGLAAAGINTVVPIRAFADNGSRGHIPGLQRMHEDGTIAVHKLCAERTHLFGHECPEDLRWICGAGGMILERIGIQKLCTDAIA